jgi:hypothetical protein
MNQSLFKKFLPHLIAIGVIVLVMVVYFSPLLDGKVLKQHDVLQWRSSYEEIYQFETKTGERTFWTNSMFSGMPSYLIGPTYHNNTSDIILKKFNAAVSVPLDTIFLLFICFYILLIVFKVNPWFSIIGALAFTFSTFNFINIDAGHAGKGNAIALMPLVLAGIKVALGQRKLLGMFFTGIALSMQIAAGHLQITYYLAIMIGIWMIAELIIAVNEKTVADLLKTGAFLVISVLLAVGTNITNLMVTNEYGKYSIRGASELTKTAGGEVNENVAVDGLDKDYALQWSNGVSEPFTLLIPNFFGGGNVSDPFTQSIMAKEFKAAGLQQSKELAASLPGYFGEQPFTAGPIYFGAIICFLFVFGLVVIKGPFKWWILAASALAIMLSMGKNFMSLTDLFFYNFPLYNKFRSVTFMLCVAQTTFPLLGLLAIKEIIDGKVKKEDVKKALWISLGVAGGLCLIFAAMPELASVSAEPIDSQLKQYGYPVDVITGARAAVRQMDALRSLFFIVAAFGAIWFFVAGKIKQQYLAVILGILVLVDLWGVDKRYLNEKDYEKRKKSDPVVPMTRADEIILQDKDPHYRVYNTTQRLDQDATTSYYHKSIGGYHGAKMRRYQELVEFQMSRRNMEVFNMLNVKYFIVADSSNNMFPQQNPEANGNAWFVNEYVVVDNADAEIDSLTNFDSKQKAFVDKRFADQLSGLNLVFDSSASIKLDSYAPNKLVYSSQSSTEQLAVFSEIHYDKGWNAYIDGALVPHMRADYVLRALRVPAGEHTIEFKFEPEAVTKGETISLGASVLLYGGLLVAAAFIFIRKKRENA